MLYTILGKEHLRISKTEITLRYIKRLPISLIIIAMVGLALALLLQFVILENIKSIAISSTISIVSVMLLVNYIINSSIVMTKHSCTNVRAVRFRRFRHGRWLADLLNIYPTMVELETKSGKIERVRMLFTGNALSRYKIEMVRKDIRVE